LRPQDAAEQLYEPTAIEVRALRWCMQLSVISLIWVIGLITLGALVSATESGAHCSGWPLCNGQFAPTSDLQGTLIFGHRFGGFVLILMSTALIAISQLRLRFSPTIGRLAAGIFLLILTQAVVGGFAVVRDLSSMVVEVHLILAFAVTTLLAATIVAIRYRLDESRSSTSRADSATPYDMIGYLRAGALLFVIALVATSVTVTSVSGSLCTSASDCVANTRAAYGTPGGALSAQILSSILALTFGGVIAIRAWRSPDIDRGTRYTLFTSGATIAITMVLVLTMTIWIGNDVLRAGVLALSALGWAAIVALLSAHYLASPTKPAFVGRTAIRASLRDFARVTKPGIMVLLLITTLGAMLIAAQGWPSPQLILLTLLGGALASGGASSLNCYYDRDIDGVMARTRKRPIPTGGLSPDQVRAFGLALSVLSVAVLAIFVNPLAATMALGGNLFYVLVYTRKLKRSTPQNIVIGGAAGSFPPLVGWAAVTGSLSLGAFLLAAIIFYWTPPHFWSLALLKANDYKRAGIPMLPVTHGEHETRRRIVLYSLLLVPVTLLMVPAGVVGLIYGITAAVLGLWFIITAVRMLREGTSRLAWPLFKYSNYYLAALLAAMALDHAIRL
jgi:heme o synthase